MDKFCHEIRMINVKYYIFLVLLIRKNLYIVLNVKSIIMFDHLVYMLNNKCFLNKSAQYRTAMYLTLLSLIEYEAAHFPILELNLVSYFQVCL